LQAWFPFYLADYVADTGQLSLTEHGAYILLMAHYYNTGKPLPANAPILHRVCRAASDIEQEAVAVVLTAYFKRDGDVYRHNRIDRELAKASEISQIRRDAANKRHASRRATDLQTPCKTDANAVHEHTQSQSQLHISTKSKSFVRPTLEEVQRYCSERQNGIDAAKWFDYYSANGWHVGRHTMKDWKAAVRHWERNNYGEQFRDDYQKTGRSEREQLGTQARRAANNVAAVLAAFPEMAGDRGPDSSGQTARHSHANPPLLEGEIKGFPR
jgi:uncharacterized protein YdaU (DUF1376 family)